MSSSSQSEPARIEVGEKAKDRKESLVQRQRGRGVNGGVAGEEGKGGTGSRNKLTSQVVTKMRREVFCSVSNTSEGKSVCRGAKDPGYNGLNRLLLLVLYAFGGVLKRGHLTGFKNDAHLVPLSPTISLTPQPCRIPNCTCRLQRRVRVPGYPIGVRYQ